MIRVFKHCAAHAVILPGLVVIIAQVVSGALWCAQRL